MTNQSDHILSSLGEVKGMLRGVTDMIHSSNEATNKRIDDLTLSINRRMDGHDAQLNAIGEKADEAMQLAVSTSAKVGKHSVMLGGGAGMLMTAAVEIIKAKFFR